MKSKLIWSNKNATIRRLVNNDKVGRFLAETWANMFEKYVPADRVILATSYRTEPFKVTYYLPYSHYQWNGISMSGKKLNYSHEKHLQATDHWEQVAQKEKGNEVAKTVSNFISHM